MPPVDFDNMTPEQEKFFNCLWKYRNEDFNYGNAFSGYVELRETYGAIQEAISAHEELIDQMGKALGFTEEDLERIE